MTGYDDESPFKQLRPSVLKSSSAPVRSVSGVPLTGEQIQIIREAIAEIEACKLSDAVALTNILANAVIGRLSDLDESSKPAVFAEFWLAVAARQGTIVNYVTHHAVPREAQ